MATSPQTVVKVEAEEEEIPLNVIEEPVHAVDIPERITRIAPYFHCNDPNHRNLAIWSIICGCSCIGVRALINSVRAKETRDKDPRKAEKFAKKARKLSLISISVWVTILVLVPVLMALISFLLTLNDDE